MKRNRMSIAGPSVREVDKEAPALSFRLGRLSRGEAGELLVVVQGSPPQPVRLAARLDREALLKPENCGRDVLLALDPDSPHLPIVVDLIEQPFADLLARKDKQADVEPREALVDGQRVVIEGQREIILRCGKGQIVIRADGKILIKGTHLVSRSTGMNKIKGGAVQIN